MTESELVKLVQGWQRKDPDATQVLMTIAYNQIKKLAKIHRQRIPEDANTAIYAQSATDLAHDVYERLVKAESLLPIESLREFYSYLNVTVRNTFIDNYRKHVETQARNPENTSLLSPRAIAQQGGNIEQTYELSTLSLHIDALEKKYPRQAEAVELRYYAQRSNKDIARLLCVSTRTVENDLRFAKAWIRLKI